MVSWSWSISRHNLSRSSQLSDWWSPLGKIWKDIPIFRGKPSQRFCKMSLEPLHWTPKYGIVWLVFPVIFPLIIYIYIIYIHIHCNVMAGPSATKLCMWPWQLPLSSLRVLRPAVGMGSAMCLGCDHKKFDLPSDNQTWQWTIPHKWRF